MPTPVPSRNPRLPYPIATLLITLLIALTANAQSQITTGTIRGTALDANGAVVPGANVEIKNNETNISRTLTTDEEGRFNCATTPAGPVHRHDCETRFRNHTRSERHLDRGPDPGLHFR